MSFVYRCLRGEMVLKRGMKLYTCKLYFNQWSTNLPCQLFCFYLLYTLLFTCYSTLLDSLLVGTSLFQLLSIFISISFKLLHVCNWKKSSKRIVSPAKIYSIFYLFLKTIKHIIKNSSILKICCKLCKFLMFQFLFSVFKIRAQ